MFVGGKSWKEKVFEVVVFGKRLVETSVAFGLEVKGD